MIERTVGSEEYVIGLALLEEGGYLDVRSTMFAVTQRAVPLLEGAGLDPLEIEAGSMLLMAAAICWNEGEPIDDEHLAARLVELAPDYAAYKESYALTRSRASSPMAPSAWPRVARSTP